MDSTMEVDGDDDDDVYITPAPKKPKLVKEIAEALEISPPPIVGRQSVPLLRFELVLGCGLFFGFSEKMFFPKLLFWVVPVVILASWFWKFP